MSTIKRSIALRLNSILRRLGFQFHRTPRAFLANPSAPLIADLDMVIHHHLSRVDPAGFFFIQVGAFDGVTNDPLHEYVLRYHWSGIMIEPQTQAFQDLLVNYQDQPQLKFLNMAVSDHDGTIEMYTVKQGIESLPGWSEQIATLQSDHILKHKNGMPDYGISEGIPQIETYMETIEVECITFETMLDRCDVKRLDLLQIDAEGYDYEIIKTINFDRIKPTILRYEHMHLQKSDQEECLDLLVSNGYRITFEFADTIAYLY